MYRRQVSKEFAAKATSSATQPTMSIHLRVLQAYRKGTIRYK